MEREHSEKNPADILRRRYILALTLLACLSIVSQIVIQWTIADKGNDSRIVNISGRQRMLSQKLTKAAIGIFSSATAAERERFAAELRETVTVWERTHTGLIERDDAMDLHGRNSEAVRIALRRIDPVFREMFTAADRLIVLSGQGAGSTVLRAAAGPIVQNEAVFLAGMERVTLLYEEETRQRLSAVRMMGFAILFFTFIVLVIEAFVIFLPAERHIRDYFREVDRTMHSLTEDIRTRKTREEENRLIVNATQKSIERAKILQQWMITKNLPARDGFDISALYIPSDNLSGDIFIVRELNDRIAVVLADCTGHGVDASMSANHIWRYIYLYEKMLHEGTPQIPEFISAINKKICRHSNEDIGYPSLCVAVIDIPQRTAYTGIAGGIAPYHFNGTTLKPYDHPSGTLIGVNPDAEFNAARITLEENDTLFFTSDGPLEEREHSGEPSIVNDNEAFQRILYEYPDADYRENIEFLFTRLSKRRIIMPLHDDASLILIKVSSMFHNTESRNTLFL